MRVRGAIAHRGPKVAIRAPIVQRAITPIVVARAIRQPKKLAPEAGQRANAYKPPNFLRETRQGKGDNFLAIEIREI